MLHQLLLQTCVFGVAIYLSIFINIRSTKNKQQSNKNKEIREKQYGGSWLTLFCLLFTVTVVHPCIGTPATRRLLLPQLSISRQTAETGRQESVTDRAAGKHQCVLWEATIDVSMLTPILCVRLMQMNRRCVSLIMCNTEWPSVSVSSLLCVKVDVSDAAKTAEAFLKIASVYKEESNEVKNAVLNSIGETLGLHLLIGLC